MNAPFCAGWVFGVDKASDVQSESVGYTSGYAIVVPKCGGASPLEFFKF
jgi:hypothetical protein